MLRLLAGCRVCTTIARRFVQDAREYGAGATNQAHPRTYEPSAR